MDGGMVYTTIGVGEGTGGGLMKHPMPGAPSSWLAYVQVDDIKAATAKARSLGATVDQGRHRSDGDGMALHLHGSDRGHAGTLAAKSEVSIRRACAHSGARPFSVSSGANPRDAARPATRRQHYWRRQPERPRATGCIARALGCARKVPRTRSRAAAARRSVAASIPSATSRPAPRRPRLAAGAHPTRAPIHRRLPAGAARYV